MGRAVPVRGEKKRSDIGAFGALHGSPSLSPVRRAIRPPLPGAKRLPSLPLDESPGATPKASISLPPQTGEPEEQSAAAARIQSRQRGRVARRAAQKRKEAHMAATRIQTRERSRAARARMESRRKQATASREDAPEPEWMEGASPSINAHGHVGGPKVHSHKLATGRHASGDASADAGFAPREQDGGADPGAPAWAKGAGGCGGATRGGQADPGSATWASDTAPAERSLSGGDKAAVSAARACCVPASCHTATGY